MPEANSTSTTLAEGPRRRVLAGGALAALLGSAAAGAARMPAANLDAELIRLCRAHDALELQHQAALSVGTVEEEEAAYPVVEKLQRRQTELAERIADIPPRGAEGWRALAGTIGLVRPDLVSDGAGDHDEILMTALLTGILGRDAGPFPAVRRDAELLALRSPLEAAVAAANATELSDDVEDEALDRTSAELKRVCWAIVEAPPAVTPEGLALKAAAVMHELRFSYSEGWAGPGEKMAWQLLAGLAGNAYVTPALPEHLRSTNEPPLA